ncbi:MAG: hypothetical protein VXZ89_00950 [Candidatus Thermoplasmatota archaeon]|nr:hypothetical protein [Candidatus Thermoplasmatota archaeon]
MSRKLVSIQRRLVSLIQKWKDPHGISIQQLMQSMDISDDAEIEINIQPSRPHCACCLFDLEEFRDNIENIKGVSSVKIIVKGIPDADRWTRALSNS